MAHSVIMSSLGAPKTRIYKNHNMIKDNLAWEYTAREPNPYIEEWQLLLDAIRQDKPHNEATRAGEAEVAALMGRIATHTGQYISWDQVMKSQFGFVKEIDKMTTDTPAPIKADERGIYAAPSPGITKEC